jgi:serine/threonine protein kinase
MKFDTKLQSCEDLKLCDFGLAIKYKEKVALTDFCGSPGFFAPEMITKGSYYGDKADIWSLGCILLELILGHENFCDAWMTAYDYEVLQDKAKFTENITFSVERLPEYLNFSPEFNDFILQFLKLRSSERSNINALLSHTWLSDQVIRKQADSFDLSIDVGMRTVSFDSLGSNIFDGNNIIGIGSPDTVNLTNEQDLYRTELLKESYSVRQRKELEDYNSHHIDVNNSLYHLPPIEPATPSVGNARKILQKGENLFIDAQKTFSDGVDSPILANVKRVSVLHEEY